MTAHKDTLTHWVPPGNATGPGTAHWLTACGEDIDGPCDKHLESAEPCWYGLAWTLSTDLAAYQHCPGERWPPPCPVCEKAAQSLCAGELS